MSDNILCYLHEDNEPDHWIDTRQRVGVIPMDCGVPRTDLPLTPADRLCATRNGVGPERIVEWVE